jgi:lipopolysaccharide biosynthesis regulator YciM
MPAVLEMEVETCYDSTEIEEFVNRNPGYINFSCEFCGVYTANKPHCPDCNAWEE